MRALLPLEQWLQQQMHQDVYDVAQEERPPGMAFIAVLLRWPDMNQARLYVLGFGSVGEMEASGPNQACEKLLKLLPEWIQFVNGFHFFGAIVSVAKSFPMAQSWTLGRHTWMVTC